MSVTGYLALYTTLIGWQQYQNLWNLMVGVGLVFIPFVGIVMTSFLEPFESQEPKSAGVIALRRLMIRIVGALIIIEFCCVPTIPLTPQVLHFAPVCTATTTVATPGNTGTTYDNQFTVPTGVEVPVFWYLVMAISNGFTHAAIESLSCAPIDYRTLQSQLDVTNISDPNLKKETIDFYNDCYVPAYSKYMSESVTSTEQAQVLSYEQQYGHDDLGWIGSQALVNVSGFYDSLSAREPVNGFPFDPTRDQFEGQVANHSQWGEPICNAWWTDPSAGLRLLLSQALPSNFLNTITHIGSDPNTLEDSGIRNMIGHSFDSGMTLGEVSRGYESLNDDVSGNWISSIAGNVGVNMEELSFYPKLHLLMNGLPVIQALLLMSIYTLLALVVPFSSYRLHFIVTGSSVIFAITFWSYLWQFVLYLDNTLIPAIFPQSSNLNLQIKEILQGYGGGVDEKFIDMIIESLYIALPLLFLTLMSWAGIKVSSAIMGSLSEMKSPINDSGSKIGNLAQSLVRSGINLSRFIK